ncbi:MAG: FAD-dependent oxidoreductase [Alphaproteobacteria bacterium]|nr:FAD-dependent oxidoreductase [Alphaproteobacteria bacterium]
MVPTNCSVVIVGGGPCGLMLANELGRRDISVVLLDEKATTAFNPQANATQARTMEHFRRLGFADEIRALGLPPDFPTDIAYFTRFAGYELGRFSLPSSREAKANFAVKGGSWSTAEPPHRVSQKFVEAVLRKQAAQLPGVHIHYGWRMTSFGDHGDHVEARTERVEDGAAQTIKADYLIGADGSRSAVRHSLGIRYAGEAGVVRDFFGGRMYAIYLKAPRFYELVPHKPAWMNVTFNPERRAFMAAVDGKGEFAFHTQLRDDEDENEITQRQAKDMFQISVGAPVEAEILSRSTWTAGYTLVAEGFQKGRVFLGGDAVHLFTPTGGLGYNTAIEDAVNLGWKLAAALKGRGGPDLLASYEIERRPNAVRNTGYARGFADSVGLYEPVAEIEDDSEAGRAAREEAGAYLAAHGKAEFNIPGITFGARFDGSPVIVSDGTDPPPDTANSYVPTACPGGRAPHLWLAPERSLYDEFGFEWTLLRLGPNAPAGEAFARAAAGLDLKVLHVDTDEARGLYGADLALIRPDQVVAWRGNSDADAETVIATVTGR